MEEREITINIPDELYIKLAKRAEELGKSLEVYVESLLCSPLNL